MAFIFLLVVQFLFITTLMVVSFWSSIKFYIDEIREYFRVGYTLTFVGIKPPKDYGISTHSMFDRFDTTKTIQTVHTKLQSTDTITDLKTVIRSFYSVPETMDILVIFSHHIISNNTLTLSTCGITDRSLLTLALCSTKVEEDKSHFNGYTPEVPVAVIRSTVSDDDTNHVEWDPVQMNAVFEMYSDDDSSDDSDDEDTKEDDVEISNLESDTKSNDEEKEEESVDPMGPRLGFDVVMQEDNVTVYKMPKCGHEMNPESLYHLALSRYSDKNNLSVECPHRWCEFPCKQQWDYHDILSVLRRDGGDYEYYKLELLASRNRVQTSCAVQKCPKCSTLYFQNDATKPDLGSIDSAESVEKAFKSECIYCSFECRKWEPYYEEKVEVESNVNWVNDLGSPPTERLV